MTFVLDNSKEIKIYHMLLPKLPVTGLD